MIKYGLISETDARTLEKVMDLIIQEIKSNNERYAFVTEIGLFDCGTADGVYKYFKEHNIKVNYKGIDNEKDKPINPPEWMNYIKGNSNEVYNQIEDNSQHLIFVDGCHCFAHVVSDFFCYAGKAKKGGYLAFHDTGRHIKPFKDFQHGDEKNPDAYISVRKALMKINMFKDIGYDLLPSGHVSERKTGGNGFQVIFDEADVSNQAGGITAFKKLY